jgi:iron complex outermembrane receptor protein
MMNESSPTKAIPRGITGFLSIAGTFLVSSLVAVCPALAQDQEAASGSEENVLEVVVVTATRQFVQDSIEIKRDNVLVVDGLSASDIGDLPALSIGEALESLTGVASHRENGGATEVSIRGLGPFLSATTFNGREATNGSGDRSVNFSQFPSELMNKLVVYKTQDATLIEGGVAGVIALETLRPLDYNKRRFQFDLKGNYNPDQENIDAELADDIGYRGTLSYVDQFDFGNGGLFGLSLGYQNSDTSQPEQETRGSSPTGTSIFACINEADVTNEGFFRSSSGDCEDQVGGSSNQGYDTRINPETGLAYSDGLDWAFAPASRSYRQNDTHEEREAFFGAFQWQPNDQWDVNLDIELSDRTQSELRNDLLLANQKRATVGVTGPTLVPRPLGGIQEWTGGTQIESNGESYYRHEEYQGGGLNVSFDVSDKVTISGDVSYSKTTRDEKQIAVRTQSDAQDIFNMPTPGGERPTVNWNLGSGIPQWTLQNFDVTDHTLFSDEYRLRIDSDVDRTNEIKSGRLDFNADVDWDGFTSIQGGIRYSELTYLNLGGTRYASPNLDDSSQEERDAIVAINEACRTAFPESGFLASEANGALITNIDPETGQELSGTGNAWATFDTMCMTDMILAYHGDAFAYPDQYLEDPGTTDVTETTLAAYLMANFQSQLAGHTLSGNVGVRIVNTDVKSNAWRAAYEVIDNGGFLSLQPVPGELDPVTAKYGYTEALPSINAVLDLRDDLLLRGAVYRAMSRADPGDLGYNRSFDVNTEEDITNPDDLIDGVDGSGNPATDPLMSWNADTAIEWYPNEDTILTFGLYYKNFNGGFEQIRTLETFIVDGVPITSPVTVTQTDDSSSTLWGVEITAAHTFTYLPGYLAGLGFKLGYNYGDSDFEFEDSLYGDVTVRDLDGSVIPLTIGIIEPGNVPGFSDTVFSGNLFYGWGKFDASIIYKYRSEYFQPYTSNGTRLRYVDDVGVWEARMSYQLTDHLSLSVEGINVFNAPKQTFYFSHDNFGERNVYGPRYFFGIRGKF